MDPRTYITVHDGLPEHPKLAGLSPAAKWLLLEVWCYCSRNLTDGFVPADQLSRLGGKPADGRALVAKGLLEVVGGGWRCHDYLEHQRSAAEVQASRERSASGAALANHKRWHVGRGVVAPDCVHCQPPDRPPDCPPDQHGESSTMSPRYPDSIALSVSVTTPTTSNDVEVVPPRAAKRTRVVEDWRPSDGAWRWAAENFPSFDLERELAQFRDHHAGKGDAMASWDAAWRTWMRNAQTFNRSNGNGQKPSGANRALAMAEQLGRNLPEIPS